MDNHTKSVSNCNKANSKAANSIVSKSKKTTSNSKPLPEFSTECNPDNNAWFEGRSNPLSSKGN